MHPIRGYANITCKAMLSCVQILVPVVQAMGIWLHMDTPSTWCTKSWEFLKYLGCVSPKKLPWVGNAHCQVFLQLLFSTPPCKVLSLVRIFYFKAILTLLSFRKLQTNATITLCMYYSLTEQHISIVDPISANASVCEQYMPAPTSCLISMNLCPNYECCPWQHIWEIQCVSTRIYKWVNDKAGVASPCNLKSKNVSVQLDIVCNLWPHFFNSEEGAASVLCQREHLFLLLVQWLHISISYSCLSCPLKVKVLHLLHITI